MSVRLARVRPAPLFIGVVLLLAVLAAWSPSVVFAATSYTNPIPAPNSTTALKTPAIKCTITDPAGVNSSSLITKLDGVRVTGRWSGSTVTYQPASAIANGNHTVSMSVLNYAGVRSTYTWTFSVKSAPALGTIVPADGSTVSVQRPTISVVVTPNGVGLAEYVMTVDGREVAATWSPVTKTLAFTPATDLRNDAAHSVSVSVTDTVGASVSIAWSFGIQIYPDMVANMGCVDCHTAYPAAHPMTNCDACHGYSGPIGGFYGPPDFHPEGEAGILLGDCTYCHGSNLYPTVPNHIDLTVAHGSTTDMTGCACHVRSLSIEHNRYVDDAGGALMCSSCHGANASQRVKDALAAGSTNCMDCHSLQSGHPYGEIDHVADVADALDASGFVCADCHAMDLATEHNKQSSSGSRSCATCHPEPRQSFSSWDQSCSTGGCHAAGTPTAVHGNASGAHSFANPGESCLASGCHAGSLDLATLHAGASTDTADGRKTSCLVCHAAGVPATKSCTGCHTSDGVDYHVNAAVKHASPTTSSCFGAGCHDASKSLPAVHALYVGPGSANPQYATSCELCHANPRVNVATSGAACTGTCHIGANPHQGMSSGHALSSQSSGCTLSGCHPADITSVHGAYADLTKCGTCHSRADNWSKTGDCGSCHTGSHEAAHTSTWTTCAGTGCHNDSSLTAVHSRTGCATCHTSTDSKVTSAIGTGNRDCTACHNAMAVHGAVHNASTTYSGAVPFRTSYSSTEPQYWVGACTDCHRVNLLADHGNDYRNCPMCHANGGPRSSFTTWDRTCQTGACHPITAYVNSNPVAPHPQLSKRPMDHSVVAQGYQAPPYCYQCHNSPSPQCGTAYGCHATAVTPVTSVDFVPPKTSASLVSTTPVTWSLSVTDVGDGVVATFYRFDGAPFSLYGPAQAAAGIANPADVANPGNHVLEFYSVDAAGNTEAVVTHSYTTGDFTAPSVSFNGVVRPDGSLAATSLVMTVKDPVDGGYGTGVATVHTEVMTYNRIWGYPYPTPFYQPMADFTYPKDGSATSTRTISGVETYAQARTSSTFPTWNAFNAVSGRFLFKYTATDFAGNQTAAVEKLVYIDNDAPATTISTPTVGVFRWKLSPSDTTTPTTYYSFDGAPFSQYTSADASAGIVNTQPGGEELGAHTLRYYSIDSLGNLETTKVQNYSIVETTPPEAALSTTLTASSVSIVAWDPQGPKPATGIKSVTGYLCTGGGSVVRSINATFPAGDVTTRTVDVTPASDGQYYVIYTITDWAGNTSKWYGEQYFRLDRTAPTTQVNWVWDGSWQVSTYDGPYGSGVAATFYSFDGAPYAPLVGQPVTPPEILALPGLHTLSCYSVDKLGNVEAPKNVAFTVK